MPSRPCSLIIIRKSNLMSPPGEYLEGLGRGASQCSLELSLCPVFSLPYFCAPGSLRLMGLGWAARPSWFLVRISSLHSSWAGWAMILLRAYSLSAFFPSPALQGLCPWLWDSRPCSLRLQAAGRLSWGLSDLRGCQSRSTTCHVVSRPVSSPAAGG